MEDKYITKSSAEDQLIISLIKDKSELLEQVKSLKKSNLDYARQQLVDAIQSEREKKFLQKEVAELKERLEYYKKHSTLTNVPLGTPIRLPEPTATYRPSKLESNE